MATSDEICAHGDCEEHYHAHDPIFTVGETQQQSQVQLLTQRTTTTTSEGHSTESTDNSKTATEKIRRKQEPIQPCDDPADHGFRRIIRNFTPSYDLPLSHSTYHLPP